MGVKAMFLAVIAALTISLAGCVVPGDPYYGYGYGRGGYGDTYYYYPNAEIYYYPGVDLYYWYEGGDWHYGRRAPERYVLRDRDRVTLHWNGEPHRDHDRVRREYPPRGDQDRGREQPRGDQRR